MKTNFHILLAFALFSFCWADDDHCCKEKSVGGKTYTLLTTSGYTAGLGCFNNCVYKTSGSPSEFCFKRGQGRDQPFCNTPSNNFVSFSSDANQTLDKLKIFFATKTAEFKAQTLYTEYKAKDKWMKEELKQTTNRTITNETADIFIKDLMKDVPLTKEEKALNYILSITKLVQTSENPEKLDTELQKIDNELLNHTPEYPDLHAAIHQGIETARFVFKFIDDDGGAEKMIEAIVANTELATFEINIDDSCRQLITKGAIGGAIAACVADPMDCNQDAINSAIYGITLGALPCIPSEKLATSGGGGDGGGGGGGSSSSSSSECFGTANQVETFSGYKGISELVIGDFVRTSLGSGSTHFTEFVGWLDRSKTAIVPMLKISTSQEYQPLILTRTHIVFTSSSAKYAEDLRPGDKLLQWNGSQMEELDVTEILPVMSNGSWSPLTRDGTLLVDGILSSCYASFNHQLADLAMSPVKAMPTILLDNDVSQHVDGTRSYVKMIKLAGEQIGVRERNKKEIPPPTISLFSHFETQLDL